MEKDENCITVNQQGQAKMTGGRHNTRDNHDEKKHAETQTEEGAKLKSSPPGPKSFIQRYAFVLIISLDTMADGLGYTAVGQFRYSFFHEMYQDQLDQYNVSQGGDCTDDELDPQVQVIENTISRETAKWGLYGDYTSMGPLLISSLVIGMKSDRIGRRFLFLISPVIGFISYCIKAVVIRTKIHYGWMLISGFISACFGGSVSMHFAAYSLISDTHGKKHKTADTTTDNNPSIKEKSENQIEMSATEADNDDTDLDMSREKSRIFKIVAMDLVVRISMALVAFLTGYVIHYAGFFYTFLTVACMKAFLFVFAYCCVTETGEQKKSRGFIEPLRTIGRALKDPVKGTTLLLVNLGVCFGIFGFVDEFDIIQTYEMSPPFCLSSVKLGWLSSENRMKNVFGMPLLWLLQRMRMSETTIAAVGMASSTAADLLLASVRHMWVFFIVPVIAIPSSLALSMGKVVTSRLIGRSALASTFALALAIEEVFWFGGSIAANYTYQQFLPILPTAPFYLASASFAVAAILFGAESIRQHRSSPPAPPDGEKNSTNSVK